MPIYRINSWQGTAKAVKEIENILGFSNPNNRLLGLPKYLHDTKNTHFTWKELLDIGRLYMPHNTILAGTDSSGQFYQENSKTDWWLRTADRQGVFELHHGIGTEVIYLMGKPGMG